MRHTSIQDQLSRDGKRCRFMMSERACSVAVRAVWLWHSDLKEGEMRSERLDSGQQILQERQSERGYGKCFMHVCL